MARPCSLCAAVLKRVISDGRLRRDGSESYYEELLSNLWLVERMGAGQSDEIARMWRFTRSNGITEGFHTKMEVLQRQAYGFRNFNNYRTRVKVLCS